jgi:dihydroorotate dehydrogenase
MAAIKKLEDLWLMNAAGMVKTVDDVKALLSAAVTHVVVGSITVETRAGNPEPTIWFSPDGRWALNSRGLPGPGLDYYVRNGAKLAQLACAHDKKLVASITSTQSERDWAVLASTVSLWADVIEVNASCPNKWKDGKNEGVLAENPDNVMEVLRRVREEAGEKKQVWLKLPPYKMPRENAALHALLESLQQESLVDALVSCNTVGGQKPPVEPTTGKAVISMPTAGMSGARLKPWSLLQNAIIGEQLPGVPRIGVGGIRCGRDIEDYRLRGVSGVAIGTEFFKTMDPHIFSDVLAEAVA